MPGVPGATRDHAARRILKQFPDSRRKRGHQHHVNPLSRPLSVARLTPGGGFAMALKPCVF
jgi:hypothetical protein